MCGRAFCHARRFLPLADVQMDRFSTQPVALRHGTFFAYLYNMDAR
jgi:hypothetical protein